MKNIIKDFLKKFLDINSYEVLNSNRYINQRGNNDRLVKRVELLEQENRELTNFISSVFPEYYRLNQARNKLIEFKGSLKDEHWKDPLISQVIMRKDEEFSKRKEEAIANNELNIKSICLKVSEELFNKLINEKFPVPEEFKE